MFISINNTVSCLLNIVLRTSTATLINNTVQLPFNFNGSDSWPLKHFGIQNNTWCLFHRFVIHRSHILRMPEVPILCGSTCQNFLTKFLAPIIFKVIFLNIP